MADILDVLMMDRVYTQKEESKSGGTKKKICTHAPHLPEKKSIVCSSKHSSSILPSCLLLTGRRILTQKITKLIPLPEMTNDIIAIAFNRVKLVRELKKPEEKQKKKERDNCHATNSITTTPGGSVDE